MPEKREVKVVTSGRVMDLSEAEMEKQRDTPTGEALREADKEYEKRRRGR